jgi:hypothetical protein
MIHSKRVIFMILPLLFVPLVYDMSSTPDACALPRDPAKNKSCDVNKDGTQTCCWRVRVPGKILADTYCQTCKGPYSDDCGSPTKQLTVPQGAFENLPTLEQVPTTPSPPPLFGRNIPLQGSGVFGQPTTTTTPTPTPFPFGQISPEGTTPTVEGEDIQPMNTTFPTPQPFPPPTPGFKAPQTSIDISPDLAPEDDQDETDDDGRNDNIPDTGIAEQPETQQPEEEPSGEEQDIAGPLT